MSQSSSGDEPLIGKVLDGRFQIVSRLGVGGMGRVYKAIQQPLGRTIALKVLNPRLSASDPGFERRFFLEASMTAKLNHPNTITVHDYGRTSDGLYFIAMEYVDGETLHRVLSREGALEWQRALGIVAQIARSLRQAHKQGLVHRDIKPGNVMILSEESEADIVKVLDFGLVKAFTELRSDEPDIAELTQGGMLLGSPLYMAPEQTRGETDLRTDVYALGIVLYQCIAGRPPFQGVEALEIIVKQVKDAPTPLKELRPEIPVEVNGLVMKCIEKSPDARFQSMDELLEAIRLATVGLGVGGASIAARTYSTIIPAAALSSLSGIRTTATGRFNKSVSIVSPAMRSATDPPAPGALNPAPSVATSDESDAPTIAVPPMPRPPPASRRMPMLVSATVLALVGLCVGGGIAFRSFVRSEPIVESRPPRAAPPTTPSVEAVAVAPMDGVASPPLDSDPGSETGPNTGSEVVFEIDSEPRGATVTRNGQRVGVTPCSLMLLRPNDALITTELVFSLKGYQDLMILAQASHGRVPIKPTLVKKTGRESGRERNKPAVDPPELPDDQTTSDPTPAGGSVPLKASPPSTTPISTVPARNLPVPLPPVAVAAAPKTNGANQPGPSVKKSEPAAVAPPTVTSRPTAATVPALPPSAPAAPVYKEATVLERFVGGKYPDEARENDIEGTVRLQVAVSADGKVTDVRVLQGLGYGLDEEAVRRVRRYSFTPATRNGVPIDTTTPVSIRFELKD